jgi:ribosomal-protein-serine acetyltransferase
MTIKIDTAISLELLDEKHATATFELINNNRHHLREWLPWIDNMRSIENFEAYIRKSKKEKEEGTDFGFVIIFNNAVAGRIGLHNIDQQNKTASIGYWLGAAFEKKGIITKCCTAIINFGFTQLNLTRIEIRCAVENFKSKAVPERLNFKQEGILKQAEFVNDKILDLYVYALCKEEWQHRSI